MTHSIEAVGCITGSILHVSAVDDLHAASRQAAAELRVVRRIDRAAQVPNHVASKTIGDRIFGAPPDAVIARESADEDLAHAMILQVSGKPGRWTTALGIPVVAKRAVRIDCSLGRLANDRGGLMPRQIALQRRAGRALHTMVGPQRLLVPIELDGIHRMRARMAAGE